MWLVVVLPDGYPGRVPVGDTDLLGERPRLEAGTTVSALLLADDVRLAPSFAV